MLHLICRTWGPHGGVTPCNPWKVNRRFRWIFDLHFQDLISRAKMPATRIATSFHAGILLGLFYPEDGGNIFLRNVGWLPTYYTALYPSTWYSSLRLAVSDAGVRERFWTIFFGHLVKIGSASHQISNLRAVGGWRVKNTWSYSTTIPYVIKA
jgi:hypothetical protein